jgi:hypothetical protein
MKDKHIINYEKACDLLYKPLSSNKADARCSIYVGIDGVFRTWLEVHQDQSKPNLDSFCCIRKSSGGWKIRTSLYCADTSTMFHDADDARKYISLWLDWTGYLYAEGKGSERGFERDWLAVKSNRSLLMLLYEKEARKLNDKIEIKKV